ncbi:MAG TPA: hypothetical protein VMV01_00320, partial [Planctomycetota bacterium]|nr:hypothetical protein [Planctomycetota bacterium]
EPGRLRVGSGPELAVGTEIDVIVNRGVVDVQGARLFADNINLAYQGRIRFTGRPQGQLTLEGPVDLAVLERHVFRSGLGFAGAAHWAGLLTIDGSRLRIEGRMQGQNGSFRGVSVPRFASWLSYDGTSGLVMRDLDVETLGGSARLAIDVPPTATKRPVSIRGRMEKADGEGVLRMLFGWGELGIGTAATGELDVSWPKGKTRSISGTLGVDLQPREDGRYAFGGRFDWHAKDGEQRYDRLELNGPRFSARVSGEVDALDRARLELASDVSDLAELETVLTRCRRGLGNPEAQPAGFTGKGRFRGRWGGTLDWPVFEGRFEGDEIGYGGVEWGSARWAGSFDTAAEAVTSHPLVVQKGGGEIEWDGRSEIGWFGARDALAGRARATAWPLEDLVRFMQWDLQATGRVSGSARVGGRRSAPEGDAQGTARDGRYYGIAYDEARLESRWKGRRAELTRGAARIGGGGVDFAGSVTDDGVYDGSAEMKDVEIAALQAGTAVTGRVSGRLLLLGTLTRPRVVGTLESSHLFYGDEGIGALAARFTGDGDGRVTLDGRCRSGRVDLALTGAVLAAPPYEADLKLVARST